jgi:hypothetical protein
LGASDLKISPAFVLFSQLPPEMFEGLKERIMDVENLCIVPSGIQEQVRISTHNLEPWSSGHPIQLMGLSRNWRFSLHHWGTATMLVPREMRIKDRKMTLRYSV